MAGSFGMDRWTPPSADYCPSPLPHGSVVPRSVVTHAHCPEGCEHPQPIRVISWGLYWDGKLVMVTPRLEGVATLQSVSGDWRKLSLEICGRCWVCFQDFRVMVPCTPDVCVEARDAAALAG